MLPSKSSWPQMLGRQEGFDVINAGINGDTTAGMLSRFQRDVVEKEPDKLLIMGGTNDFYQGLAIEPVASNLSTMIFQAIHYRIQPIVMIPPPIQLEESFGMEAARRANVNLEKLAELIGEMSQRFRFPMLNFFQLFQEMEDSRNLYLDDIHLNERGNRLIKEIIQELL